MKNLRLSERKGIAQIFLLIGMLMVAVALPVATKLVQKNQENRSNAASSTIIQDSKCKNAGGTCQKTSTTCSGSYKIGYCPSSDSTIKCCVKSSSGGSSGSTITQDSKCKNISGTCQKISTSCSGTKEYKSGYCPSSGSDVKCCAPKDSSTTCGSKGGDCVASGAGMTGGVKCTISSTKTGKTNLAYSCSSGQVCCLPTTVKVDGVCTKYSNALTRAPDATCVSGTVSWTDSSGSDGTYNWKCLGINNGNDVSCSAKKGTTTSSPKPVDCDYGTLYSYRCSSDGKKVQVCKGKQEGYVGVSYSYEDYASCSSGCEQVDTKNARCKQSANRSACNKDAECISGKCAITDSTKTRVCIPATGTVYVCDYYYDDAYSEKWIDGKVSGDGTKCGNGCNISTGKCNPATKTDRSACNKDAECISGKCAITDSTKTRVCIPATGTVYVCDYYYDDAYSEKWIDGKVSGDGTKCSDGCNISTGKCNGVEADCTKLNQIECQKRSDCFLPDLSISKYDCETKRPNGSDCKQDSWCVSGFCNGASGFTLGTYPTGKCASKDSSTSTVCESKGGDCVASGAGMTSGISCKMSSSVTGVTNLIYSCSSGQVCCLPTTVKVDGVCTKYSNTLTRIPDTTCASGKVSWVDKVGTDGVLNWKCTGSNGGSSADCTAFYNACGAGGGTCRTVCGSNEKIGGDSTGCRPAVCCVPASTTKENGVCNSSYNGKTLSTHPTDSQACTKGGVYWNDISGSSGQFKWQCQGINGGTTVSCSAKKGTSAPIPTTGGGSHDDDDDNDNTPNPTATAVPTSTVVPTVTTAPTATAVPTTVGGSPKISFKFSLRGIKPSYLGKDGNSYDCFDKLGGLTVDVVNSPTNTYQIGLTTKFEAIGETNVNGDQVFKVTALALDSSKFSSVNTYNYVKIKGPFHVKRRMCMDGQTGKLPETTVCNISLKSDTVYDFSDYTLLAGDIDANGIVNSVDYSIVKSNLNASADISCGRRGDLNMDGVVNWIDGSLISKEALSSRDDE